MQTCKNYFTNRIFLISFFGGITLLLLSLITRSYVSQYLKSLPDTPVNDLILSNIRVYDVSAVFIYGSVVFLFLVIFIGFKKINTLPFILKSIALFNLIRFFFVIMTHISAFPTQIVINSSFWNSPIFDGIFTGNDLFFSGHTGLPFLLALIFWDNKNLRIIFLSFSIIFGIVVLLGHIHYSIDVLSAYFITYGIFVFCKILFKKEWQFFLEKK